VAIDAVEGSEALLEPFPDDVVRNRDRDGAVRFLLASPLLGHDRALALNRFSKYTGLVFSADDFRRVQGQWRPAGGA
jgi:hypothetical protein